MRITFHFAFWLCLWPLSGSASDILLQALGQADREVVTTRDVQISKVVERALSAKDKSSRSDGEMNPASIGVQDLTPVLLEWVVYFEAESFKIADLEAADVQSALTLTQTYVKDWPYWQRLEVSNPELQDVIKRKLRAKKLIKFKTESTDLAVPESEIKDYFDKNRIKFGNMPLSAFRDNIRAFLSRQNRDKRLRDWFEVLKTKYKVKVYSVAQK